MSTDEPVRVQHRQFLAALPELLVTHLGEWAVWHNELKGTFPNEWDALGWASKTLGDDTPFVIAAIAPQRTVLLTAALAFGGGGT